jgi:hypothetical protein
MTQVQIQNVYLTRVVNEAAKKYAFGITEDNETAYFPGRVVEDFDLNEDDIGTKNRVALLRDEKQKADWVVTTLLVEDSVEVNRLKALLDEHGIDYDDA